MQIATYCLWPLAVVQLMIVIIYIMHAYCQVACGLEEMEHMVENKFLSLMLGWLPFIVWCFPNWGWEAFMLQYGSGQIFWTQDSLWVWVWKQLQTMEVSGVAGWIIEEEVIQQLKEAYSGFPNLGTVLFTWTLNHCVAEIKFDRKWRTAHMLPALFMLGWQVWPCYPIILDFLLKISTMVISECLVWSLGWCVLAFICCLPFLRKQIHRYCSQHKGIIYQACKWVCERSEAECVFLQVLVIYCVFSHYIWMRWVDKARMAWLEQHNTLRAQLLQTCLEQAHQLSLGATSNFGTERDRAFCTAAYTFYPKWIWAQFQLGSLGCGYAKFPDIDARVSCQAWGVLLVSTVILLTLSFVCYWAKYLLSLVSCCCEYCMQLLRAR